MSILGTLIKDDLKGTGDEELIAQHEITQLEQVGKWFGLAFVAIGYMAQSIVGSFMGKAESFIEDQDCRSHSGREHQRHSGGSDQQAPVKQKARKAVDRGESSW